MPDPSICTKSLNNPDLLEELALAQPSVRCLKLVPAYDNKLVCVDKKEPEFRFKLRGGEVFSRPAHIHIANERGSNARNTLAGAVVEYLVREVVLRPSFSLMDNRKLTYQKLDQAAGCYKDEYTEFDALSGDELPEIVFEIAYSGKKTNREREKIDQVHAWNPYLKFFNPDIGKCIIIVKKAQSENISVPENLISDNCVVNRQALESASRMHKVPIITVSFERLWDTAVNNGWQLNEKLRSEILR